MIVYVDFELGLGRDCASMLKTLPNWKMHRDSLTECETRIDDFPTATAWDDSKLIGFLSVQHVNPSTAELYAVAVAKDYQGQGIGSELLHQAERDLARLSQEVLVANIQQKAVSHLAERWTLHFFKRNGFVQGRALNDSNYGEHAFIQFTKRLPRGAQLAHSLDVF